MWIYILISVILLLVMLHSFLSIRNNPNGGHKSWLSLILPGLVSIIIIINNITVTKIPEDIKLVNYSAEKIRKYCNYNIIGNHSDRYTLVYKNNLSEEVEVDISKNTYRYFYNLWSSKKFEDKHTCNKIEEVFWDKEPSTSLIYSKPERYVNYMKNVFGLYEIYEIGVTNALQGGLYVRQGVGVVNSNNTLEPRQNLVIGINIPDSTERKINYVASLDKMFRPVLLVWNDEDHNKTLKQRSLWEGGKENEVVFCVGLDETGKIIKWSDSFSWSNSKKFESFILSECLSPGKNFDIEKYAFKLEDGYKKGYWDHINLEDYNFVKIPLRNVTIVHIMFIVLVINIIAVYFSLKKRK